MIWCWRFFTKYYYNYYCAVRIAGIRSSPTTLLVVSWSTSLTPRFFAVSPKLYIVRAPMWIRVVPALVCLGTSISKSGRVGTSVTEVNDIFEGPQTSHQLKRPGWYCNTLKTSNLASVSHEKLRSSNDGARPFVYLMVHSQVAVLLPVGLARPMYLNFGKDGY